MTAKLCLVDHAIEMFLSLLKTPTGSKSRVRRGLDARSARLLRMLDLQFALSLASVLVALSRLLAFRI